MLHDEDLANEISELKSSNLSGDTFRERLLEMVGRNYKMLSILLI